MKKLTILLIIGLFLFTPFPVNATVYTDNGQVEVQGDIPICNLNIVVKPEKRIPPVNNWGNNFASSDFNSDWRRCWIYSENSNYQGITNLDLCDRNIFLKSQNYNFMIWGESHLKKLFKNIYVGDTYTGTIDFSANGERLLAGETSNIYDNKINSLDISTQITHLFTNDYKNDLIQDSEVNSLDISNTVTNFYLVGN